LNLQENWRCKKMGGARKWEVQAGMGM